MLPSDRHRPYKTDQHRGAMNTEHGINPRRQHFSTEWPSRLELRHESTRFTTRPGT